MARHVSFKRTRTAYILARTILFILACAKFVDTHRLIPKGAKLLVISVFGVLTYNACDAAIREYLELRCAIVQASEAMIQIRQQLADAERSAQVPPGSDRPKAE